jgi:predicted deacylase
MGRSDNRWIREKRPGGPTVEFPLAEITGEYDGPTVAVISGMHGGEYAGILAAQRLIQRLERAPLRGRVLVVPILSIASFFSRTMQLSAVDEREAHYVWPGHPAESYTAHLIDLLFRTIRSSQFVLDLHGGELVQDLVPHIRVPWLADGPMWSLSLDVARSFDVKYVDKCEVADTPHGLPHALLDVGIPNLWTEIGHNGLLSVADIRRQLDGVVNALRTLGSLPGKPARYRPRYVGPKHWSIHSDRRGLWRPAVRPGQTVRAGQLLGELFDVFGERLESFRSPADALVEFLCTSPPIDITRQPHGYRWHQWLVQLAEQT